MKHQLYLLCLLLAFACGRPLRVVRVAPPDEDRVARYAYGQAVQRQRSGAADVELAYYDATEDYLVFDLTIANMGGGDFLFDPATVTLVPEDQEAIPAVDPEFHLLSLDLRNMRRQRTSRTLGWVGAAVLVGGAAYAVANDLDSSNSDNDDSAAAYWGASAANASAVALASGGGNLVAPDPENRYFWLEQSLRKTTLRPGEAIFGKLVFPRTDEARNFTVELLLDGGAPAFPFAQSVYR